MESKNAWKEEGNAKLASEEGREAQDIRYQEEATKVSEPASSQHWYLPFLSSLPSPLSLSRLHRVWKRETVWLSSSLLDIFQVWLFWSRKPAKVARMFVYPKRYFGIVACSLARPIFISHFCDHSLAFHHNSSLRLAHHNHDPRSHLFSLPLHLHLSSLPLHPSLHRCRQLSFDEVVVLKLLAPSIIIIYLHSLSLLLEDQSAKYSHCLSSSSLLTGKKERSKKVSVQVFSSLIILLFFHTGWEEEEVKRKETLFFSFLLEGPTHELITPLFLSFSSSTIISFPSSSLSFFTSLYSLSPPLFPSSTSEKLVTLPRHHPPLILFPPPSFGRKREERGEREKENSHTNDSSFTAEHTTTHSFEKPASTSSSSISLSAFNYREREKNQEKKRNIIILIIKLIKEREKLKRRGKTN